MRPRRHGWGRWGAGLLLDVGDDDRHRRGVLPGLVVGHLHGNFVPALPLVVQGFFDLYLSGVPIDVERGCAGALQRVLELAPVVDVLVGRADRVPHGVPAGEFSGTLRVTEVSPPARTGGMFALVLPSPGGDQSLLPSGLWALTFTS